MNQTTSSRTNYCGLLRASDASSQVTLMGWVHNRRDLGNLIFLSLRDREGIVQVTVNSESVEAFETAKQMRSEFVVLVQGEVVHRSPETVNPDMPSGEIEVLAKKVVLLNRSDTPPISLSEKAAISEENRLRYRYLDLRRPQFQRNLKLRHQIALSVRKHLDAQGFLEIETPFLTKSTPEGARDYLVPSRLQEGTLLCASSIPTDLQADPDDLGIRSLLPDRTLLPRRGSKGRSSARIHTNRHRDVFREPRDCLEHGRKPAGRSLPADRRRDSRFPSRV